MNIVAMTKISTCHQSVCLFNLVHRLNIITLPPSLTDTERWAPGDYIVINKKPIRKKNGSQVMCSTDRLAIME